MAVRRLGRWVVSIGVVGLCGLRGLVPLIAVAAVVLTGRSGVGCAGEFCRCVGAFEYRSRLLPLSMPAFFVAVVDA